MWAENNSRGRSNAPSREFAVQLLGREVHGRSDLCAHYPCCVRPGRETEVYELAVASLVEQDILRLEISVDIPRFVDVRECDEDLAQVKFGGFGAEA